MAVPGKAFDPDHGNIATKAAETIKQRHLCPRTCGGKGGGQTAGAGPDHQHAGLVDHRGFARGL